MERRALLKFAQNRTITDAYEGIKSEQYFNYNAFVKWLIYSFHKAPFSSPSDFIQLPRSELYGEGGGLDDI